MDPVQGQETVVFVIVQSDIELNGYCSIEVESSIKPDHDIKIVVWWDRVSGQPPPILTKSQICVGYYEQNRC